MWQGLTVLQIPLSLSVSPAEGEFLWRTCLRQLLFLAPGAEGAVWESVPGSERYADGEAHRFLVEVCSGLHSPLLGETEVFGQFRDFRASAAMPARWVSLCDAVEEDVRKVRRSHLIALGAQSYGSLARKRLPPDGPVVMVGAGRLAQEILPWLEGREVFLFLRDPAKAQRCAWLSQNCRIFSLGELDREHPEIAGASWLVVAPVASDALLCWFRAHGARVALDFRGEERLEAPPAGMQYFGLQELFSALASAKRAQESVRAQAKGFAAELVARREASVLHRPFGWEDAFA